MDKVMYRLPDDLNRNFTQILISKNLQNQINIFAQSGFAIIGILPQIPSQSIYANQPTLIFE